MMVPTKVPNTVVYNSVDLAVFTDQGQQERPADRFPAFEMLPEEIT